jgi:hypothetical protein
MRIRQTGMENRSDRLHLSALKSYLSDTCSIIFPIARFSLWLSASCSNFHHCRVFVLIKPVCHTSQTGICVQKLNLAFLSSFIHFFHLLLFLMAYTWFVHLLYQEKLKPCPPKNQVPNIMKGGIRTVVMWMSAKAAQEMFLYEDQ